MSGVVVVGDAEIAFCEQHQTGARDVVFGDCFADDLFAAAIGVDVGLGGERVVRGGRERNGGEGGRTHGVPGIDSAVVGVFEKRSWFVVLVVLFIHSFFGLDEEMKWCLQCFLLVQDPILPLGRSIRHGSQNDLRDLEA